jgi:hypothetical protein
MRVGPLILMILVILVLPESYRFLIVKGKNPEKVRKILNFSFELFQFSLQVRGMRSHFELELARYDLRFCVLSLGSYLRKERFCFG